MLVTMLVTRAFAAAVLVTVALAVDKPEVGSNGDNVQFAVPNGKDITYATRTHKRAGPALPLKPAADDQHAAEGLHLKQNVRART